MRPDPAGLLEFPRLVEDLGYPALGTIAGEAGWKALLPRAGRPERRRLLGQLRRHLLCQTVTGRARLRKWLDAQRGQPIVVEKQIEKWRRIKEQLQFFGDQPVLPILVGVLFRLPRPVVELVLTETMTIAAGWSTGGWTCGKLPDRLPIVLDCSRSEEEIAHSFRHEIGHRWHIDHSQAKAPTSIEHDRQRERFEQSVREASGDVEASKRFVRAFVEVGEMQAEALAVAWASEA